MWEKNELESNKETSCACNSWTGRRLNSPALQSVLSAGIVPVQYAVGTLIEVIDGQFIKFINGREQRMKT